MRDMGAEILIPHKLLFKYWKWISHILIDEDTITSVFLQYKVSFINPYVFPSYKFREPLRVKRPVRSFSPTIKLTLPIPPLNHVPKCNICTSFKNLQGWWLHCFLGQSVPVLDNSLLKNFFLSNLNLSWPHLRPFPFVLSLVTCEKGMTPPHFTTISHQAIVENIKVPFLVSFPLC